MPVLSTTSHIAPKSALRYRPIADKPAQAGRPVVQRASRAHSRPVETEDQVIEWQRAEDEDASAGSAAAHRTVAPSGRVPGASHMRVKPGLGRRVHPLMYLGLGMIAMLALWVLLTLVVNWWTVTMDDIHYGRPRTFQMDAFVGHNEAGTSSHFIALNYRGRIEVIEFPGGDATHARIYLGPQLFGAGNDLTSVTLSFVDVNNNQKPDMIVHFQDSRIIFINDQGSFRPPTAQEQQAVEHYLAAHGQ